MLFVIGKRFQVMKTPGYKNVRVQRRFFLAKIDNIICRNSHKPHNKLKRLCIPGTGTWIVPVLLYRQTDSSYIQRTPIPRIIILFMRTQFEALHTKILLCMGRLSKLVQLYKKTCRALFSLTFLSWELIMTDNNDVQTSDNYLFVLTRQELFTIGK